MKNIILEEMQKGDIHPTFFRKNKITPEEAYCLINDIVKPKCDGCDNTAKFRSINKGYMRFCSRDCSNKYKWTAESSTRGNAKRKEYWEQHPDKLMAKNNKISYTNSIVWGSGSELRVSQTNTVKNGIGFDEIHRKGSVTKLKKYGHCFGFNSEFFRNRMIAIYGVNNARLIDGMTTKIQQTFFEKYGVINSISLPGVREKAIITRRTNFLKKIKDIDKLINYVKQVWHYTNKNDLTILKNYELRGRADININAYHLDHKYSISEGYLNNIPPEVIGNINNLEMLFWKDNIIKSDNCSITLGELYENV